MSSKRDDLQVIRGVAIISVLLFHFYPEWFPNGYVGVDQFFVLSGFLMMMIFGSKTINLKTSGQFYYRRIKRIVPLYLLVVLIGLILAFIAYPESFVSVNVEAARNAILFITNVAERSSENDYFLQLETAYDIFTHTWSLAVEMQFYLIAPLFFFVCSKLGQYGNALQMGFLLICYGLSLGYQCLAPDDVAFNSMLCRLWQFETGIIAYCPKGTQVIKEKPVTRRKRVAFEHSEMFASFAFWACLFAAVYSSFIMVELPSQFTRICSTIAVGVVIVLAPRFEYAFMSNRVLVFAGDISYALYLVHWPIYCWVKSVYKDDFRAYTYGLLFSVLLAIIISKTFEKWYLRQGFYVIVAMMVLFDAAITGIIVKSTEIDHYLDKLRGIYDTRDLWHAQFEPNMGIEEVTRLAKVFGKEPTLYSKNCLPVKRWGHCDAKWSDLGRVANYSILILGNSYAENAFEQVARHFAKFASKIHKLTYLGCGVLEHYTGYGCSPRYGEFLNFTTTFKPDILFVVAKHMTSNDPIQDIKNDKQLKNILKQLKKYEEIVKKRIYILDGYGIVYRQKYWNEFFAALNNGSTMNIKAKELYNVAGYNNTFTRYQVIHKRQVSSKYGLSSCTKCVLYSYVESLSDPKGNFLLADPDTRLPLFHPNSHLSPMGQRRIEPVYEKLARDLEKEIKNKTFV